MKITLLGTGTSQGVPVIACDCAVCRSTDPRDKRLRVSVMVEASGTVLVIDAGPDFRQQMLREDVQRVDAILLTHKHKDHIAGLDDVRAFNFKYDSDMPIYADADTQAQVHNEFPYVFAQQKYPGIPRMELHLVDHAPFEVRGLRVEPLEVLHGRLPVRAYRIGNFAYVTDASLIPPASMEKLRGLDTLILNALRHEEHPTHFNIAQALEVVAELKPRHTYFTHISHLMGKHADVELELPENVFLAYDGLKLGA